MRSSIFLKLLAAFVLVIIVSTVTLGMMVRAAWHQSVRVQIDQSLSDKVKLFAHRVQTADRESLQQIVTEIAADSRARATVIDKSGRVLADSEADPATMENHGARPEFVAALGGKLGSDTRSSHTVGAPFLYTAAPVRDGAVRLAYPLSAIQESTRTIRNTLLKASIIALVLAMIFAAYVASVVSRRLRNIVEFSQRISDGDLSARIDEHGTDEIAKTAAALDATARKLEQSFGAVQRSREELETVLNSMQEGVIAVARDGRVLWVNRQMRSVVQSGVRIGAPLTETLRDPDFLSALQAVLENGGSRSVRLASVAPGRVYNAAIAPMPDGAAVAVLYDLTAIERVEKTRRDFIANVSHELRTPLTSIQGYAETLLEGEHDSRSSREFLEIIRRNAWRMTRLTDDLLTLARVESREHRFDFHPALPSELLNEAAEVFRESARGAGVALEIEAGSVRPVNADPDAIHQVFSNLIENALKYAAAGKRIIIGSNDNGDFVQFYVQDYGPGIASEHLPRLFERFYRIDKARSRESGGTGLGLAIAKHIVLAHGGTIEARSDLHQGATFSFTLPIANTHAAQRAF
ncbi:MAG TPA: ATP-binding protein [Terriglobales bacterium]|nr:ATP-binding protein [Terriglobales bacterium]